MATLEDKLLGEKLQYYCSSSSSEDENEDDEKNESDNSKQHQATASETQPLPTNITHWSGTSQNTGPKGVVQDWQLYKKLEAEKREENERQRTELMKKLSLTASTSREDEERKKNEEIEAELAELMNDDFLQQFQKQRMAEMLKTYGQAKTFGKVIQLTSRAEFLDAIEKENKNTIIIIHIYEKNVSACNTLNQCLDSLAADYNFVKFCKIISTTAGMSKEFKDKGLPSLLVYKNKQLIGNFVRISDELSDDFFPSDVESFLIEKGMIPDKSLYSI